MGKFSWGKKKNPVTYSSTDEYVILTKERSVKNRMACHSHSWQMLMNPGLSVVDP